MPWVDCSRFGDKYQTECDLSVRPVLYRHRSVVGLREGFFIVAALAGEWQWGPNPDWNSPGLKDAWLVITKIGSDYEEEIEVNHRPNRYRHRLRGQEDWITGAAPKK